MSRCPIVLTEQEHAQITAILERLLASIAARSVFLANRNGEQIAAAGSLAGKDSTALGSLAAGSVAATRGLARLIGEPEFSALFHEGSREHLQLSHVSDNAFLLIHFDARTTLGLVRLRARAASGELAPILDAVDARAVGREGTLHLAGSGLAGITDDEIDALLR